MENIAQLFQSLDDETRLRILALLLEEDELCVCDLVAVLQLPQSTVSRQLSLLKNAGWLKDRREGVWMLYSIDEKGSALHSGMIAFLRPHLAALPTAASDLERLTSFADRNICA